jgi:Bacteriophage lambda head decoration protein D
MAALTETVHDSGFVVSEANGHRSREEITLLTGFVYEPGRVLGVITASGKYAPYNNAASDGTQTAAGVNRNYANATAGDKRGVVYVRDCEVNIGELVYTTGTVAGDKTAAVVDLATKGVIARDN